MARMVVSVVLAVLLLSSEAFAVTQVIPGDGTDNKRKLTIFIGDDAQLQAKQGKQQDPVQGMFFGDDFGPAANYWHLRIKSGPSAGTTISPNDSEVVPVSNGPVTGNWTPPSPAQNVTVIDIRDPQNPNIRLYRIRQTVLFVGFSANFRVVWEISPAPGQPNAPAFIFGTSADLYIDSDDRGRGVFVAGAPNRFVGGTNATGRVTGGIQEVSSSTLPGGPAVPVPPWASYEEGQYSTVTSRLESADAFTNTIDPNLIDNGAGVSWNNRASDDLGLGETQRYEVVWHLKRSTPLTASPAAVTKQLPGPHQVVLQLTDAYFNPVPGQVIRYEVTGPNPQAPALGITNSLGQVSIQWNGQNAGVDTLTAYADSDNDGIKDASEPATGASVRWIADNHVAGASQLPASLQGPNGGQVPITTQPNPTNPEAPTHQVGSSAAPGAGFGQCTFDQRNGWALNLPVTTTLEPGGGAISGVELFLTDPGRHDPNATPPILPPAIVGPQQNGNSYTFTIPCVVTGQMWVRFTLTEGANVQTLIVPVGGLQLIDPQGVVYDGAVYDQAIAGGMTPEQARSAAAIAGATVTLQREAGGGFVTLLSDDPGILPNVNPQVTPGSGIYQWDVSPGRYRVEVSAASCASVTSPAVEIPPPVLDLHVRMSCAAPAKAAGVPDLAKRKVKVKKGVAALRLACPADVSGCTGKVKLAAKKPKLALGKKSYEIAAGTTEKVKVKIKKRAAKRIAKARIEKLKASATYKPSGGGKASKEKLWLLF